MKLTKDQDKALVAIDKWLEDTKSLRAGTYDGEGWMFSLAGYAGTGKTTLLAHLIQHLKNPPLCAAPTGKAASVLRSKLKGVMVKTIHQVLYQPHGDSVSKLEKLEAELAAAIADDKATTDIRFRLREEKQRLAALRPSFTVKPDNKALHALKGNLIIIDEASMVSTYMLNDLRATGCRVLFVGDSGQLPPVRDDGWFIERKHNACLNEIMRQALDSPIIRLSMQIRDGDVPISEYNNVAGAAAIVDKMKVDPAVWLEANQVLTGSNFARRKCNRFFRQQRGWAKTPLPRAGDKMICLKNDHHQIPAWINGVQFSATGDVENMSSIELPLNCDYGECEHVVDFYPYHCMRHYTENILEEPREMRKGLFEADYAYCVTVHKSQGSEWPFVILADDGFQKGQVDFRKRFLYTAVTRAKERFLMAITQS